MTDAEKLRLLARWHDEKDNMRGYLGAREVQDDLRRIADLLEAVPPEVLKALAYKTWKAVPVEPTRDQLRAVGCHAMMDVTVWDAARDDYRAMLASALEKPE